MQFLEFSPALIGKLRLKPVPLRCKLEKVLVDDVAHMLKIGVDQDEIERFPLSPSESGLPRQSGQVELHLLLRTIDSVIQLPDHRHATLSIGLESQKHVAAHRLHRVSRLEHSAGGTARATAGVASASSSRCTACNWASPSGLGWHDVGELARNHAHHGNAAIKSTT